MDRIANARRLRAESTEAERILWGLLRGRRQGFKFRRQVPIDRYFADFACVEAMLVVELDGGQHVDSEYDVKRTAVLEALGWRVVRFWNTDLSDPEAVVETIQGAINLGRP